MDIRDGQSTPENRRQQGAGLNQSQFNRLWELSDHLADLEALGIIIKHLYAEETFGPEVFRSLLNISLVMSTQTVLQLNALLNLMEGDDDE